MTPQKIQNMHDAIALLQVATNQVYNIDGQVWQLSYEVLDAIVSNLKVELSKTQSEQPCNEP
jgi:hypothetical protein